MSNKVLQQNFDQYVAPLAKEMLQLNWQDSDVYAQWLAQTYYFVSNSTRLIALSGSMFPTTQNDFHKRFVSHAAEEMSHEKLAIADLKRLGKRIDELPQLPETGAFWQSQVYWTLFKGPMSFYGYIFCLEGLAVEMGAQLYAKLKSAHGEQACNFIRVHAEEDTAHLQQAFDLVAGQDDQTTELICENLRQCCGMYRRILDQVEAAQRNTLKRVSAA